MYMYIYIHIYIHIYVYIYISHDFVFIFVGDIQHPMKLLRTIGNHQVFVVEAPFFMGKTLHFSCENRPWRFCFQAISAATAWHPWC